MKQHDLDSVFMENNGKHSANDSYDCLHLEKNNNLWGDEDNPLEPH